MAGTNRPAADERPNYFSKSRNYFGESGNPHHIRKRRDGAHEQNRTADRLLTMQVLYRLSYVGSSKSFSGAKLLERETGFEPATLSLEG